jgi:5-methylcytosine-specific restriction protein A
MQFVRGNRAIRDHVAEGKDLHLFRYVERGYVEYLGQMVCIGYHERLGPDAAGSTRRVLVFELLPISSTEGELGLREVTEETALETTSLGELRARALASATDAPTAQERIRNVIDRSVAVKEYVLERADGECEGCRELAPFVTDAGRPYLEPHHIRRLSDGGPDHPEWVAALCPNCHRRAHYSVDRGAFNRKLSAVVVAKEEHR